MFKGAVNVGDAEVIQELNVLNGQGCCDTVEEGGIAGEGVGATERFERIARETMISIAGRKALGNRYAPFLCRRILLARLIAFI